MLQQQTAEIKKQAEENRKAQLSDLKEIARNMELTTKRQVDEIKNEVQLVKRDVGSHGEDIKQVQTQMQKLENRLMVVESRALSSAAASTTGTEPDRSLSVIMGGWPRDTKKEDLLKFGKNALEKIDAARYLDSDPFATGLRRGFLLSNLKLRLNESLEEARERVSAFVRTVNEAQFQAEGIDPANKLWASRSRGKAERERAHAGKIRRVFHVVAPQMVSTLECEYGTGTVFCQSYTLGSAVRIRPDKDHIAAGRGPGFWADLEAISRVTGKSVEEIGQQWAAAISN